MGLSSRLRSGSDRCIARDAYCATVRRCRSCDVFSAARLGPAMLAGVVAHFIPREFLGIIRADPAGFVHRCCRCLSARRSWVGAGGPNGSNRPSRDIRAAQWSARLQSFLPPLRFLVEGVSQEELSIRRNPLSDSSTLEADPHGRCATQPSPSIPCNPSPRCRRPQCVRQRTFRALGMRQ